MVKTTQSLKTVQIKFFVEKLKLKNFDMNTI